MTTPAAEGEIRIDASARAGGPSSRVMGSFRPMTVDEADTALVNGLIDVQEFARCLVSVEPLVDTLFDVDDEVRKEATVLLKKRADRAAVRLLERALEDPAEEVRLFAAEALDKLDSMYNEAIAGLIERIKGGATRRLVALLGRVYFDYAAKGMYDPGMREVYFEKAARELERALTLPADADAAGDEAALRLFLGASWHELGRWDEALAEYRRVKELQGSSADLLVRVASVRFAQGRYDEVRRICALVRERYGEEEYGEILQLWTAS